MHTPWGKPNQQKTIVQGIVRYDTPSHGGYHLDQARLNAMPDALRSIAPWAGEGWYEEDCDWAIVALAFPQHFSDYAVWAAVRTAIDGHAEYHGPARDWLVADPQGQKVRERAERFAKDHAADYVIGSMSTGGDGWRMHASSIDGTRAIVFEIKDCALPAHFPESRITELGGRIVKREGA